MAIPTIMGWSEWERRTTVANKVAKGDKKRSADLVMVDTFVKNYEKQANPSNLEMLKRYLDAWVGSKTNWKGQARASIRDFDGAVTALKRSVDLATTLRSPIACELPGIFVGDDVYRGNTWVPDTFAGEVNIALRAIRSQPIGRKLLDDLSSACTRSPTKKVVIEYGGRSTAAPIPVITNESRKKVQPLPHEDRYDLDQVTADPLLMAVKAGFDEKTGVMNFVPGGGTGAVVTFNHDDKGPKGEERDAFIGLAHELVHAYHYVLGMCYRAANGGIKDGGDSGLMEEEMRTVGILAYAKEVPSENAIRGEHGVKLRTRYSADASFDKVIATALKRT